MGSKIINDFYDFIKWFMLKTAKFPRNYRYTFGEKLENFILGLLEQFIKAKFTKDRHSILIEINMKLEILRYYIRICNDLELITSKSYNFASEKVNVIGRQLGGWIKKEKSDA